MTVYASTAAVSQPRDLWQILSAYRDAGIGAVELGHADLADATDLIPRLRSYEFRYLVHNYFPPPPTPFVLNLASADAELSRRSRDLVHAALELTAEIGAPFYSVHCGWITDPIGFDGTSFILPSPARGEEAEARARFVAALADALARASQLGLSLLVETSVCTQDLRGKLLLLEADDLSLLFEELDSPSLGLLVDTGHLTVTSTTLDFDRLEFVDTLASHVRAWHVHENDGVVDEHRPIDPGSWAHELIRSARFAGVPVIVESHHDGALSLSTFMRALQATMSLTA